MPATGPDIAGHRHLRLISDAGGYGDVHLYEEIALGRRVAVKVIREADVGSGTVAQFLAEANTMARLEHPNIVRVYACGQTSDGRPYISMQYCADDTYEQRLERERLSVAEVLSTGVRIGSAVETAHRAGLLHRDIKPANILKTPWGAPGLTDFGVAHQISGDDTASSDVGVSIPWSPPEMLYTSTNGSPASDVYSLAATLWHLLVGRPPFDLPSGDNSLMATMARIRDLPPPATGRPDVPETFERVLRQALAKNPQHRPLTMAEFVRNLQSVERDLRLPVTEAVVTDLGGDVSPPPGPSGPVAGAAPAPGSTAGSSSSSSGAGTVIRPRSTSSPTTPSPDPRQVDPVVSSARTQLRSASASLGDAAQEGTLLRPRVTHVDVPMGPDPEASRSTKGWLLLGAAVLLAVAVGVGWVLAGRGRDAKPAPSPSALSTTDAGGGEDLIPPGPVTVSAARAGDQVTFTWTYSAARDDDEYRWRTSSGQEGTSKDPTTTLAATSADPVCLSVIVVRLDGSSATKDWSAQGCG